MEPHNIAFDELDSTSHKLFTEATCIDAHPVLAFVLYGLWTYLLEMLP